MILFYLAGEYNLVMSLTGEQSLIFNLTGEGQFIEADIVPNIATDYKIITSFPAFVNEESIEGIACDMSGTTGLCFAIWSLGTLTGGAVTVKMQESDTQNFDVIQDITGAVFDTRNTSNYIQAISFTRTKLWVRAFCTLTGGIVQMTVVVLQQKQ